MKTFLLIAALLITSVTMSAQREVTKFLGIPVDGNKSEMISKLKAKGFRNASYNSEALIGQFNGAEVNAVIVTNNDKVCRIALSDVNHVDVRTVQIRFNHLCEQFENNSKYMPPLQNYAIPDNEDVSYEITVNKKRYEAVYYQKPAVIDTIAIIEKVQSILLSKYTEEQLTNPTEDMQSEILKLSTEYVIDEYTQRPVWFMISDYYGKYYISMFYDNEYNRANGEEL